MFVFKILSGEDGRFFVRVKGNVKVDWYKGDKLLEDVGHVVIVDEDDGETFTLALEEASSDDSGMYKCVASNKAGTVTSTAMLTVHEKLTEQTANRLSALLTQEVCPPFFEEPQKDIVYDVCEGDTVGFNLNVHGKPQPEIQWLKDDEKLSNGDKYCITKDGVKHELRLQNITIEDSGFYKCVACNDIGVDERTFKLDVEGKQCFFVPQCSVLLLK